MDNEVESSADNPVLLDLSIIKNIDPPDQQPDYESNGKNYPLEQSTSTVISSVHETKSEEDAEKEDLQKIKETRQEKKKRLKARFIVEETNDYPQNLEVDDAFEAEFKIEMDTKDTAISTPTRLSKASTTLEFENVENITGEEEEDETDLLLNFDDSDEEDDHFNGYLESQPSQQVDTLQAKANFLENFEVPSLSDISESDESFILRKVDSFKSGSRLNLADKGKFVDPLTGLSIESMDISSTTLSESSEKSIFDLESLKSENEFEFNELLQIKKVVVINDNQTDVFEKFTKDFITISPEPEEEDPEAIIRQKEVLQITIDFLFDLFNTVVEDAENMKANTLLKNSLDKKKLLKVLKTARYSYLIERELNSFLNLRMADYYRRLRNSWPFARLSATTMEKECARYKESLIKLDYYLKLQASTKTKNAMLMPSVLMDLAHMENITRRSEQHLGEVMLGALGNKSENLKRITIGELKLMKEIRNEISDARLNLITRKHTFGRIHDKILKLEQINESIHMEDFISIQNQVTALTKKIEERNVDLKKFRLNYHNELHVTQHNREKTSMLASKLEEHNLDLKAKLETQRLLRERLYKVKMERAHIRKRHSDLSYEGGLLSLPALMLDYDVTVTKIKSKQDSINEMKETVVRLNKRIHDLETRCP